MTEKEYAEKLYWKYYNQIEHYLDQYVDHVVSKMCAILDVNGHIDELTQYSDLHSRLVIGDYCESIIGRTNFFNRVKRELEDMK